ncbi:MAG: response regulator transcription factor [Ktedonobacteraceae bacterium]
MARGQVLLQAMGAAQLLAGLTLSSSPSPPQPQSPAEAMGLTEREREVLRLIVQGRTNSEIATELIISEATVKTHINHIFAKLGLATRTHAVVLAHQLGLSSN